MTPSFSISFGTIADYAALAALHYRPEPPALVERVLVLRESASQARVAVLTASRPTLNAPWRRRAWPALFDGQPPGRAALAAIVNAHVRTISRVIVHPDFRALGLATRLIRAYLDDPLTTYTEAIADMGLISPLFERAGMQGLTLAPPERTVRLLAALAALRLDPCAMACPASIPRRLRHAPMLDAELRRWANASRATRSRKDSPIETIMPLAARAANPRCVYVHAASAFSGSCLTPNAECLL